MNFRHFLFKGCELLVLILNILRVVIVIYFDPCLTLDWNLKALGLESH